MTRQECEDKLLRLAEQMEHIYTNYNPDGCGLSVEIAQGRIRIEDRRVCDKAPQAGEKQGISLFRSERGAVTRTVHWTIPFIRRVVKV